MYYYPLEHIRFLLWLSDLQAQGQEWNHPGILLSGNRRSLNYMKVDSSFRFGICSRVSLLRRMLFSLASTILMAPIVSDILCSPPASSFLPYVIIYEYTDVIL